MPGKDLIMDKQRLEPSQRLLLALGALVMLAVAGMFHCPSLAVGAAVREGLTLLAVGLSVLCVSLLIEDLLVRPARKALRAVSASPRVC
jgi:hypothetical protein